MITLNHAGIQGRVHTLVPRNRRGRSGGSSIPARGSPRGPSRHRRLRLCRRPAAPPCGLRGRCRSRSLPASSPSPPPGPAGLQPQLTVGYAAPAPCDPQGHSPGVRTPEVPRVCGGLLSQRLLSALRADPRSLGWTSDHQSSLSPRRNQPTRTCGHINPPISVGCWYLNTCVGLDFFHILQAMWNFPLGSWRNSPRNSLKTMLY